jgi:predicted transcriptional regulator
VIPRTYHAHTRGHRSQLEVMLDVMRALRRDGPMPPTKLMYRTNTAWVGLRDRWLPPLVSNYLVIRSALTGCYFLTQRGSDCLAHFDSGLFMLDPSRSYLQEEAVSYGPPKRSRTGQAPSP